jgi:hypothetical protein
MTFRHFFTFLGSVLALTLVPASAQAANLFIDDSGAQITLTHDANWELGVLSNGRSFPGGVAGSTTAPGEVATFSGSWLVNSPGNPDPGTGVIYFADQASKKHSCMTRRHDRHHHSRGHADVRGGGGSRRGVCVSDIVRANWSTVAGSPFGTATISFTIMSNPCGRNLGALPRRFAGVGVPDPANPTEISGLFRHPGTAAPVAIPSNLTVQFVGNAGTACKHHHHGDDGDDEDDD